MRAEREAFPPPPDERGAVAVAASSAAVISPPEKSCTHHRMLSSLAGLKNKRARTFSSPSAGAVFQRGSLWPKKQRESSKAGKDLQARPVQLSTHHRAEPISTSVSVSKKGCKEDAGNCRPVSLSSVPGKVMEQTVLGEIRRHVRDKRGIRPSQRGFTKGRSCSTKRISSDDLVTRLVDEGKAVDVVCPAFYQQSL